MSKRIGKLAKREYADRNQTIRALGLGLDYGAYLMTPLWDRIRTGVLERDKWTCQCCGERAYQVHHQRYTEENLSGQTLRWMIAICRVCHAAIEYNHKGKKLAPSQAQKELEKIAGAYGNGAKVSLRKPVHTRDDERPSRSRSKGRGRCHVVKVKLGPQKRPEAKKPGAGFIPEVFAPKISSSNIPPTFSKKNSGPAPSALRGYAEKRKWAAKNSPGGP